MRPLGPISADLSDPSSSVVYSTFDSRDSRLLREAVVSTVVAGFHHISSVGKGLGESGAGVDTAVAIANLTSAKTEVHLLLDNIFVA